MALATSRVLASGCAALLVFSSAVGARADAVVVEKYENINHVRTVNTTNPALSVNTSPFFSAHTDGTLFEPYDGWAPATYVQAAVSGTSSTTPKKSFNILGDSTAAGNWTDGNGIPAGITLTFDAQFTISALQTEPGMMLTTGGASNTNQSGRGIGLTVVPGGHDDIEPPRGLLFSPVTVSNVSFTGSLADPGFSFTPGGVSNFGVQLFQSGQLNENTSAMRLTQGEDAIVDPGEETIGWGNPEPFGLGTLASKLLMETNFGIYQPGATPPLSSHFPRQSGPFTIVTTAGSSMIRGLTLGYDVTYDISPAGISPDGDYNNDGTVDAADYVMWKKVEGTNTDLPNDGTLTGTVGAGHYNLWREKVNEAIPGGGAGSGANAGVPEPTTVVMLLIGGVVVALSRRHTMVS